MGNLYGCLFWFYVNRWGNPMYRFRFVRWLGSVVVRETSHLHFCFSPIPMCSIEDLFYALSNLYEYNVLIIEIIK